MDEDNSRHAVQVLRMQVGDSMYLTDGQGHLLTAVIKNNHKKHCEVQISHIEEKPRSTPHVTIAIAPTKNNSRFEWFIEKAVELGVNKIIPLISKRTEKQKFKTTRIENILISAMLQSQQTWLTEMPEPIAFNTFISDKQYEQIKHKYIAHCNEGDKHTILPHSSSSIVLIGPEGDFTSDEIDAAIQKGYQAVTLGNTRLRTETAGIVAATLLRLMK